MSLTYLVQGLDLMRKILSSYGVNPDALLIEAGIDPSVVNDSNERIPVDQRNDFLLKASRAISNPNFGLEAGQYWHPTQMGALGYAWMTSSTLRTAFHRAARFARIVLGITNITVEESADGLSLNFDFAQEDFAPDFRIDLSLAVALAMIRCNAGQDFQLQAVQISHPKPASSREFDLLFQCPIAFDAGADGLTISLKDADVPRSCSNKQLAHLHDTLLLEYVAKLDKNNIVEKVKLAIIQQLSSGYCSDSAIADSLLLSQRTLQRRLEENNTSFKILLNEVRHNLADKYLSDNSLTLTEISYLLGFSEVSAFSRAFKRWSGDSPSVYRAAH